MPNKISLDAFARDLKPGMRVFLPGMSGESLAIFDALSAQAERCDGVEFVQVAFPGINRSDFLALHPGVKQRAYFMQAGIRKGLANGRAELLPLDYPAIYRDLSALQPIDIAVAQLSQPDHNGRCSLGTCSDFQPAVLANARRKVGHINPRMPRTAGSFDIAYQDLDTVIEADAPLVEFDAGAPSAAMRQHAALIAQLVRDGDTLEFGIGKLQAAIPRALESHRHLKVYSGMASTPLTELLDSGAVQGARSVQIGIAMGDANFYARCQQDAAFYFRPVSETHDVRHIGAIERFCAINSAVEVDLFGQTNADSVNGKLIAGVGGLPAFAAGARLSPGGRSIIALPSATDDGRFSRIVPTLSGPGLCALPRHVADYVVTERGIAELAGKGIHQRARALINIAAPQFQEPLERHWAQAAKKF